MGRGLFYGSPNGCMLQINNIIVSGEAILSADNSGKLTALPQKPWWGGGCALPPFQEPHPALGLRSYPQ